VFEDQLPSLDNALTQFMATHTDGTQKQTLAAINAFRAYNPNYTMLEYQLGTGNSPAQFILNNQWASDWSYVNSQEAFFAHQTYSAEPQTASDLASGRVGNSTGWDQADIANPAWQQYTINSVLQNIAATGANGWFADSFTYGFGGGGYSGTIPVRYQGTNAINSADWPGGATWDQQLSNWVNTIESAFASYNASNGTSLKFIPNLYNLTTGWMPTAWYQNVDGALLENFGDVGAGYDDPSAADWVLEMNRGLALSGANKIVIMQPYLDNSNPDSAAAIQQREYLLGTYMLLQGEYTYINISEGGVEPFYFPEYQLNLGAASTPLPTNISSDLWNGVYRRNFQNGFVLVNPNNSSYTLNLGGTYQLATPSGGGILSDAGLDANGNYIGGSLTYQSMSSITLAPGSAAIFLNPTSNPVNIVTPAGTSANPVTGTTVNLSVLGSENGSGAGLLYTWSSTGPAAVKFSSNGTNAAQNTTATFTQAGSYAFTATVTDGNGNTATSSVVVTVNQTLTKLVLSPSSASVPDGTTEQLSATALDQFGNSMTAAPSITWSIASGGAGTINSSGLYTAPASGAGSATVVATSGTVSGTASLSIVAETLTMVDPASASTTQVTGTTVNLSALASLNGSNNGLTYTWSGSGPALVQFSSNGTNTASNTTATFTKVGTYKFTVNVADVYGQSVSSSVTVTVLPVLTTIKVAPKTATISAGTTKQFTATAYDQFANMLATQPAFTWTRISGSGMVNMAGLYTAGSTAGTATIEASVGPISGAATVTVTKRRR
jgi:hypothetical protein